MIVLSLLLCLSLALNGFLFGTSYRFGAMMMNVEDNLQKCLDILDERFYQLKHVFDDSPGTISEDPLVKNFMELVVATRNDVLVIANILSNVNRLGVERSLTENDQSKEILVPNLDSNETPRSDNK